MSHPSPRGAARIAVAVAAVAIASGRASLVRAQAPARGTIVIDGSFDDWIEVLTNPLNAARDGQGNFADCGLTPDRDCFVADLGQDLAQFGWTWNVRGFDVFARFQASPTIRQFLYMYQDSNLDAVMSTGEPVIGIELLPASRTATVYSFAYRKSGPGVGDALNGAGGLAR